MYRKIQNCIFSPVLQGCEIIGTCCSFFSIVCSCTGKKNREKYKKIELKEIKSENWGQTTAS